MTKQETINQVSDKILVLLFRTIEVELNCCKFIEFEEFIDLLDYKEMILNELKKRALANKNS